jgi:hypothetical protein
LVWRCTENGRKFNSQNSIVLYMYLEIDKKNRWQDDVREDGCIVGGEE